MPCGKEQYIEINFSTSFAMSFANPEELCKELSNQVMKGELFGFLQADIHVPGYLIDKFSEFCLLFVVDTISTELIPLHMKEYQNRTGREKILGICKLLGVMRTEKILLYMPLLKWYLSHLLKVTAVSQV